MKKIFVIAIILFGIAGLVGISCADTATVNINAQVLGACKFTKSSETISTALNPVEGGKVVKNGQLQFWCTRGANYTITDNKGQHGTYRVKHATEDEYIPYAFEYQSSGVGQGPRNPIDLNITVTFEESDYQNALVGAYSDTVTLTINP